MGFKIQDLKNLLSSLTNKNISHVKIKSSTFELIINKNLFINTNQLKKLQRIPIYPSKESKIQLKNVHSPQTQKTLTHTDSETYSTIISPMVGTFYRSPAPNEKAFIEKYDIVKQKQTVCIIEAMKLMNEIEAEVSGEIVEILVKDGDIVDCGQALMKVKLATS